DGFSWRRERAFGEAPPPLQYTGKPYRYEITLEPTQQNTLIALELPQNAPAGFRSFLTFDYQLVTRLPLMRALNYQLVSYPQHRNIGPLPPDQRRMDLELPRGSNPRSMQLARQLRAASGTDAAYVAAVLDYLRHGGFQYTLEPPLLGRNSIDDLLFHTRQGFCEHY